jgi:hypothetical protein
MPNDRRGVLHVWEAVDMNRPPWLLVGIALVGAFMGGAVIQGQVATAVGLAIAGAFSLIVAVTVTAPASKRQVYSVITSDESEDVAMRREFVATLAAEAALAFDAEKDLPAGSARPVTALLERVADSFLQVARVRQSQAQSAVRQEAKAAGYTPEQVDAAMAGRVPAGLGGDFGARWTAVQAAAEKAGRPIPPGLAAKVESGLALSQIVGSVFGDAGGKNGGKPFAPGTPARRVSKPVDDASGLGW